MYVKVSSIVLKVNSILCLEIVHIVSRVNKMKKKYNKII